MQQRLNSVFTMMAVVAAMLFAAMYFFAAIPRVLYPYDLDFIEDSMLMESLRFAGGQPVFVPPNADFDPHNYMPLYSWLGGFLIKVFGPSFVPLRLLSLSATLATALLIYWIARRVGGRRWIGTACAGLFLGGYRITGFWYELVRVDSLAVALALGGLALGIYAGHSNRRLILSAVILALAFFTKQTALLFGVGLAIYLFFIIGRRAWQFSMTYGLLTIIPLFALNAVTGGWFLYHTFTIAAADPIEPGRILRYLGLELFGVMLGLCLLAVMAGLSGAQRAGLRVFREQPWLVAILMAVTVSGTARASVGGNLNTLLPAYALLCLAPALLMREWSDSLAQPNFPRRNMEPTWDGVILRWRDRLIAAGILIQFALGVYYPPRYIPGPDMRRSGDRLLKRIASIDGQVLVMMHPYYAFLAGKQPSAQIATLWRVRERGRLPIPEDFVNRIQTGYYATIISDESSFETEPDLQALIGHYYIPADTLDPSEAPPTNTGVVVRPRVVYLPMQP